MMKFLSFSQPWLWSITDLAEPDAKRIENRTWQPPIEMIGKRFALHAAKSFDDDAIGMFVQLGIEHPARRSLYVSSAIVGVATIDRIVTSPRTLGAQARWFFGPFGWVLSDVRKLATPIEMKGAQGLRYLDEKIEAAINLQLESTGSP